MTPGDDRLKRLKDLVERLERLPASPERDRVLGEVRARAVDVDTGEETSPMKVVDTDLSMLALARRAPSTFPVPQERPQRSEPEPAAGGMPPVADEEDDLPAAADGSDPLQEAGEWLSLEDSPLFDERGPRHARPWTLGLRG